MSVGMFFYGAVFGEIYSLKKILKKYLTKREKSGKIGKLSERVVKIQRLKLCQNSKKKFEKSFKKVLTRG